MNRHERRVEEFEAMWLWKRKQRRKNNKERGVNPYTDGSIKTKLTYNQAADMRAANKRRQDESKMHDSK